jgi:hypothetical protein
VCGGDVERDQLASVPAKTPDELPSIALSADVSTPGLQRIFNKASTGAPCNKGVGDVGTGPNSRTEQNRSE